MATCEINYFKIISAFVDVPTEKNFAPDYFKIILEALFLQLTNIFQHVKCRGNNFEAK